MSLSSLPPELLHEILIYLPISNLLAFARTCRENFATSTLALQTLHLAVLPRRIYGVLTFLNTLHIDENDHVDVYDDAPSLHQVTIPSELPIHFLEGSKKSGALRSRKPTLTPAQYREQLFALQNKLACSVLSTSALSKIQTLSLHLYELTSLELTTLLATSFDSLRNLHLNFSHPYLHDTCLPAHYWTSPIFLKGSPIWNPLAGLGDLHATTLKLRTLETLAIERAGITSVQLRRWIEQNPRLRQLTLRNVLGVDHDFVEWLGEYYSLQNEPRGDGVGKKDIPARLEKLALEHCSSLVLKSKADFTWLDSLFNLTSSSGPDCDENLANGAYGVKPKSLEILSLLGSSSNTVYTNNLLAYLEEGKPTVKQVTLPDGRILIARSPQHQPRRSRRLARDGLHTRGTATRNASTRSLNDVEAELEVDNHDSDADDGDNGSEFQPCDRKPGSVSFLCEKKSSSMWKGHWSTGNNGGRGPEGSLLLQPGNGAIEVDERHAALHHAGHDDATRLLRPVVRRMRS